MSCVVIVIFFYLGTSSLQSKKLTVNSLLLELESVSSKWYELALVLGVSADDLEKIRSKYPNTNPDICMVEALGRWLKANVHASWNDIVTAVSSSVVGDKRLAGTIQLKYCSA